MKNLSKAIENFKKAEIIYKNVTIQLKKLNKSFVKTLILFLILTISIDSFSQNDHLKYAAFNVITNSIIGGIGSGIHKKSNETFFHAFGQGAWKGTISGSLNTISKEMLFIQSNKSELDWKLCWGSKIVNSFSNTMLYNATMNESNLFKHYAIDIGFLRFSTDYKVQIEPISLGCFAGIIVSGGKFDVKKSLIVGTPIFEYSFKKNLGKTYANNIVIEKEEYYKKIKGNFLSIKPQIILHELTHTYQRLQYSQINNFFNIYNKYENLKYFHNDLSSFDILYLLNKQLFEQEAYFYGNN